MEARESEEWAMEVSAECHHPTGSLLRSEPPGAPRMLKFLEARQIVLDHIHPLAPCWVSLAEALGRAVAEDLHATEPVPPFTNSAMDGFAFRAAGADATRLRVCGELMAGQVAGAAVLPGTALRIMTGAPMPEGADTVVPLELTTTTGEWIELLKPLRAGANVRLAGEDIPAGGVVVRAGTPLRPGEIGVLASVGFPRVPVFPRARVAVLTTGDELVDCGARPGPGQIRDANIHALCAQLQALGADPRPYARVPDQRKRVAEILEEALTAADVILTTGGVSVGDSDFVKPVLEALGAEQIFWRVAQKPGGPLGFWMLRGKPVFGIPGNPVAAMLMVEEYVRPALRKLMGFRHLFRPERVGSLDTAWRKSGPDGRVHFLRVVVREEDNELYAALTGPQGAGILSSMLRANALAVVSEDQTEIPAGGEVRLHLTELAEDY